MHGTTIQKTLKNARYNNTKNIKKCTVQQYKKKFKMHGTTIQKT